MKPQLHKFKFRTAPQFPTWPEGTFFYNSFIAADYAGAWAQAVSFMIGYNTEAARAIDQITAEGYHDIVEVALETHEVSWREVEKLLSAQ